MMIKSIFQDRPNRFVIHARRADSGETVKAYCPNTSRLIGLLDNKPELLLEDHTDEDRKTDFTVRCIRDRGTWVGIEAAQANDLFEQYLRQTPVAPFDCWVDWDREVAFGGSQLDFRGEIGSGDIHWVEIKSLSSREADSRRAFFSGTPSERGWRHLRELGDARSHGNRATCLFVVQRDDVDEVGPGAVTDPGWIRALNNAHGNGVEIRAVRCIFLDDHTWQIDQEIPVRLENRPPEGDASIVHKSTPQN